MEQGLKYYMCVFYQNSWATAGESIILMAKSRAQVKRLLKEAYPNATGIDIRLMEEQL